MKEKYCKCAKIIGFIMVLIAVVSVIVGAIAGFDEIEFTEWLFIVGIILIEFPYIFGFDHANEEKYKDMPKTDKGKQSNYYLLSNRRKLIRSLISFAVTLTLSVFMMIISDFSHFLTIIGSSVSTGALLQTARDFLAWKKERKNENRL